MTTPSAEEQPPLPLQELELTPEWVKSPERDYSLHREGEGRPERADRARDRGLDRERGPRRPPPSGGEGRPSFAGRGEFRQGGKGPRRPGKPGLAGKGPMRPAGRPAGPPPSSPIEVFFLPEEHGFAAMIETMRQSNRAYPLFDLARLVLNKPERHVVKLLRRLPAPPAALPAKRTPPVETPPVAESAPVADKPAAASRARPPLVCAPATGDVFLDREDAWRFLFIRRMDTLAREKKTPIEPPKGNFTFVNRCGITGVWLGPPNYHEYQARLVRYHQMRLRDVPFEQFRSRIQTVKDPAAVKAWIESVSVKTEYECLLCAGGVAAAACPAPSGVPAASAPPEGVALEPPGAAATTPAATPPAVAPSPAPKLFASRDEVEKHIRETHLDSLLMTAPEVILTGPDSRQLQHHTIANAVRLAWESERKFPIRTVNEIRPRLQKAGFHFFKQPNGVTYISHVKPQRFEAGQELTEHVRNILGIIRHDAKCTRKKLLEKLFLKPAEAPAAPAATAPAPAAAPAAAATSSSDQDGLLADLHWLLAEGYLIELADGVLWSPPDKVAPPAPAVTVNAREAEKPLTYAVPPTTLGLKPSFGFGDRIGSATPGHVEALRRAGAGIAPIFIQQSIREMTRTSRSPRQVMEDAQNGLRAAGWDGVTGADADHLKTPEDVDRTAAVGFTFFTIDPSGAVDQSADNYDPATLEAKFAEIRGEVDWFDDYNGRTVPLGNGAAILFTEHVVQRAAVKYGRAIRQGLELARHIRRVSEAAGRDYEIELSVDETPQPTTLAEHYIIADQCLKHGMKLVSLAPRFIGDLEKGVDYRGDVVALEHSLLDHNAIAEHLGPYKLSLHSGSDKLSMYTAFARATKGRFHVKTAGTSYLEALRVALIHEPGLFRRITDFARERYDTDKATYHVHATLADVPPQAEVTDDLELERLYLERWDEVPAGKGFTRPGRQILHCTFGSVLQHLEFGPALRHCLHHHADTYREVLAVHFARHLAALQAGMVAQ